MRTPAWRTARWSWCRRRSRSPRFATAMNESWTVRAPCSAEACGPGVGCAKRRADALARVLAWEVGEATRKATWSYRHESGGAEQDAWLRALVQIGGRVLCGGPARSEHDGHRLDGA
jgi:hypothetical protein